MVESREANQPPESLRRTTSTSLSSETSQTAQDYIASQLRLEADAREALPYQFDACTKPLGPLRQSVFACLTCTPPPASIHQQFTPAGVCYSCSISCHGEHDLVELFTKRDFVCDCGTTRFGMSNTPCALRVNTATGKKGNVSGEEAWAGNKYNQNFQGKFCGCGEAYDPEKEKGTMFQCLGLGTVEDGGCGEDWWHPECLMGLPRVQPENKSTKETNGSLDTVQEEGEDVAQQSTTNVTLEEDTQKDDPPLPDGFPDEEAFDHLICYKCADAFPWIKRYAGTSGFLPAVPASRTTAEASNNSTKSPSVTVLSSDDIHKGNTEPKKRKADEDFEESQDSAKRVKADESGQPPPANSPSNDVLTPKHASLCPPQPGSVSLFLKEDFRDYLCRCSECFPQLARHKQLLEEEETYEPPLSETDGGDNENSSMAGRSVNSGSLLERGEAALSNMDRVRAIEGVMAYNHVKEKVKEFLAPFAESGQAVGAEDIKAYFAKLRGDEQAMRDAAIGVAVDGGGQQGDHRREQGGY